MKDQHSRFRRFRTLSRLGRTARGERGQAAVELAIILPVFLALVFGVIELGKGYSYWVDMTHLAGEGGRYASVSWFPGCAPAPAVGACSGQTLQGYVIGASDLSELADSSNPSSPQDAGCLLPTQTPAAGVKGEVPCKLRVTYCYPPQGTGVTAGQAGSAVRVNLESVYRLSLVSAALGIFPGGSNLADINLKARSTIRLERPIDPNGRLGLTAAGVPINATNILPC